MIKLDVFALKSKSEVESYEFFDKNVRKLPKNADGTFDKALAYSMTMMLMLSDTLILLVFLPKNTAKEWLKF